MTDPTSELLQYIFVVEESGFVEGVGLHTSNVVGLSLVQSVHQKLQLDLNSQREGRGERERN